MKSKSAKFKFIIIIIIVSCSPKSMNNPIQPSRGEPALRQGNLAVYQLFCDSFDSLPLELKRYAYHLYRASVAGRAILFDQHAPRSLEIDHILRGLMTQDNLPLQFKTKLEAYAVRFWAFNGNYDYETSRKFAPDFSYEEMVSAVNIARKICPDLPDEAELQELKPFIFDVDFRPVLVNKNPSGGEDNISASAVNFYDTAISRAEIESAGCQMPLNGRLVKAGGALVEETYRAGAPNVPPGRMAGALREIIYELEAALQFAPDAAQPALKELIRYFHTGDMAAFDQHCRLWVKDTNCPVDYILGFIETYADPLGMRGSFEGMVFVEDTTASKAMQALAQDAEWFEQRMPWEERFKKTEFTLPTARAFSVLIGAGDGGPHCPAGINLPNDQRLRETVGTKNFLLTNVLETGSEDRARKLYQEFLPTEDERRIALAAYKSRLLALIAMHEVTGHGSGKADPSIPGDPADLLKEFSSTLEEARADLVAYYFIGDPHLIELGVHSPEVTREGAYRALMAGALVDLRDVPEGDQFEEDHARAGWLIANYILHKGVARLETIDGKRYYRLNDVETTRQAIGELLAEIQRIKATGDYNAAKKLVETFGMKFNPALRDEVVRRAKPLNLPERFAFIMPDLELVRNRMGGVEDVKIVHRGDFVKQMLEFGNPR
ncbi:MAG: hypothetical protein FJY65_11545 [Calditrichaeota bacterium]|nr:hypothetical protein [Calditrichota bacterium]